MRKPGRLWGRALATFLLAGVFGAGAAYSQVCDPLTGEVGRWQAEGDALDCAGSNHGTLVNGAGFGAGRSGQAFALDGVDDYVAVPDAPALDFTTQLTLSAWVNPDNPANGDVQSVVSKPRFSEGTGYRLDLGPDGTPGLGMIGNDESCVLSGPAAPPAGQWTLLTATFGAGEMKLYVDGRLVSSASCGITLEDTAEPLQIGREFAGLGGRHFEGAVDDVRVFNRALTASEVLLLFDPNDVDGDGVSNALDNCPTTFNPDQADEDGDGIGDVCDLNAACDPLAGEVARWQADGNALDCVGSNHGTLVFGAGFGAGQSGQAFAFDGVDDSIEVPDAPALDFTTALTLAAWVNPVNPANGDLQTVVSKPNPGGGTGYRLGLGTEGAPNLGLNNGDFNCVLDGPTAVPAGEWTHLAVTWGAGGTMRVYVNGRLVSTQGCGFVLQDSAELFQIGREFAVNEGGRHFGGAIDDIRVFNRALTAAEVARLFDPNDSDGDGYSDFVDNCPAIPNPDQADRDGDQIGDACDLDNDNDGVGDAVDNCPFTANSGQADSDSDGLGDACDNCPENANADQLDQDLDGLGNACDADLDGDEVIAGDNCPVTFNPGQTDFDLDGSGDACDYQLVRRGGEIRVNTTTAGDQLVPDVAVDSAGNFVVVWAGGDFSTQRIYAQRYDASGAPLGSEFQVNTYTGGYQTDPRVGMDAAGNFVVVWMSFQQNPPAIFSIMGQRFDSAGNPVGGEFAISEPTQTAGFPDMAMDAAGSFLVAWEGRPTGSFAPASIHTRLYGSDGNPVQEPIALTSAEDQYSVSVSAGPFIFWTVAWAGPYSGSSSPIQAAIFSPDGLPFLGPIVFPVPANAPRQDTGVAASEQRIVASWTDYRGEGSRRARLFSPGGLSSGELQVSTLPMQPTQEGSVAMDALGRFVNAWTERDLEGESVFVPTRDGSSATVIARAFDADGNPLGDDFIVNTTTEGFQASPRLAMTPSGRLVATWIGPDADHRTDVFAQVFAPNATPMARCRNLTVPAGPSCTATASIDNGSSDLDATDTLTLSQTPAGPYALGATSVTLTVTDNHGGSSTCTGTVTVTDTTPPAVTCPAPITVDGTTAANGATVSFTVSATDACDASVSVVATPASGSLFPFGTTPVNATATDDGGNSAQCTFTVTVLSPQSQIDALVNDIDDLVAGGALSSNNAAPLTNKLDAAGDKLDAGQTGAACNSISSFINQVNAYVSSGKLTAAQGQALISAAQSIQTNLGC